MYSHFTDNFLEATKFLWSKFGMVKECGVLETKSLII